MGSKLKGLKDFILNYNSTSTDAFLGLGVLGIMLSAALHWALPNSNADVVIFIISGIVFAIGVGGQDLSPSKD